MAFQTIFKRYELKYILTLEQKEKILAAMEPYMVPDQYGKTTIRNLYFDTDHYRLIRHSIDKPSYKEKLRVRSYAQASSQSVVFVELKKKYKHVVYKRRLSLTEEEAMAWLQGVSHCSRKSQIVNEIDYFLQFYENLTPKVFLSYQREAYYSREDDSFRVTFDDNILCRQEALSLQEEPSGKLLLPADKVLMEIKCAGGIPLWMTHVLSQEKIYKTSFSKYGTAYQTLIFPQINKGDNYS